MRKLLKSYGFNSDMQYYEMIAESFINGQNTQAKAQFKAMPKSNRVDMLRDASLQIWESGIDSQRLYLLFDLI